MQCVYQDMSDEEQVVCSAQCNKVGLTYSVFENHVCQHTLVLQKSWGLDSWHVCFAHQ